MAIPYSNAQLQQMLATEDGQLQLLLTPGLTPNEVNQILQTASPRVRQQYQMQQTLGNIGRIGGVAPGSQLNTAVPGYSFPTMPSPGYVQDPFISEGAAERRRRAEEILKQTDPTNAPLPTVNSPGYDPQTGYRQNPYTGQWEPPQTRTPENYTKAAFNPQTGYNIPAANAAYQGLIQQGKTPEQAKAAVDRAIGLGTAGTSAFDQWRMAGELLGEVRSQAPAQPRQEAPLAAPKPAAAQTTSTTAQGSQGGSPAAAGAAAYQYAQGANVAPSGTGLAGAFVQGAQGGPGYGTYGNAGFISDQMGNSPDVTRELEIIMELQNLHSAISSTSSWDTGRSRVNKTAQRIQMEQRMADLQAELQRIRNPQSAPAPARAVRRKVSMAAALAALQQAQTPQTVLMPAYGPQAQQMPTYAAPATYAQTPQVQAQDLAAGYQTALDAANAANDARYQTAVQETLGLRDRTMEGINSLGDTQRRDIDDNLARANANTTQSAINRGLYNTTILDSLQQGNQRTADRANQSLEESLNRQRIDADLATTQNYTGLLERKNDVPPDPSQLINLSQGLGQSGGLPAVPGAPIANTGGTAMAPSYFPQQQQQTPAGTVNPYAPVANAANDMGFGVIAKRSPGGPWTDGSGNPVPDPTGRKGMYSPQTPVTGLFGGYGSQPSQPTNRLNPYSAQPSMPLMAPPPSSPAPIYSGMTTMDVDRLRQREGIQSYQGM